MITSVTVVVPARDEQDEIGGCLSALATARAQLESRGRVRCSVVVVLDDCRDRTAEIVAGVAGVKAVTSTARSVGAARRTGAAQVPPSRCHWLASTDADCRVPEDWLVRMVAHADAGADLVLGTVRPSPGLTEPVSRAWFAAHEFGDGHPHVHAANLGIRGSLYVALGGWAEVSSHEDADLVARAERVPHVRVLRSGDAPVVTSSRSQGRTPDGFAGYLRDLGGGVGSPVASPAGALSGSITQQAVTEA